MATASYTVIPDHKIDDAPRRVEGRDKVTGRLRYVGDLSADLLGGKLDCAVPITATQASGTILAIDTREATASPGVRIVLSHENAPRLKKQTSFAGAEVADLPPLQDAQVRYGGQIVAVVVADTMEHARRAALLVRIRYSAPADGKAFTLAQAPDRNKDTKKVGAGDPGQVKVGHAERAFEEAPHTVDMSFASSPHHHCAIEPGAVTAAWDGYERLTIHVPTQFPWGDATMLGQAFGFGLKDRLPRIVAQVVAGVEFDNNVRVVAPPAGGSFGGKQGNIYIMLAAMAAQLNGRPVKVQLARADAFTLLPFRSETRQRMRLGADEDGKLMAIIQDSVVATGAAGQFVEPMGESVTKLYASPNILVHTQVAQLDTGAAGWMRGPGASLGTFAVECAMDELAHRIGMDPLQFRLLNYADADPETGHEWSSKTLRGCYEAAGRRIGWFERDPAIGSMREGRHLVGLGMATSVYPVRQLPAVAKVRLNPDGRAVAETAAFEMGQGITTALTQVAADALGLPLDHTSVAIGDTELPFTMITAGSMGMLSNAAAVTEAAGKVKAALLDLAVRDHASPLHNMIRKELDVVDGYAVHPDGIGESVAAIMARHGEPIEAEAITGRTLGKSKYGRQGFGAQFARVLIDPETCHIQLERLVGAFAGGRLVNPLLVRSQLIGGMVWGIGQALIETSDMDPRTGMWMNRSLGEALVPTNADVDRIEVIMLEEDDSRADPLGIKGMGEIGSVGGSAAIANAIFHATGVRATSLPIRIDRLLEAANAGAAR